MSRYTFLLLFFIYYVNMEIEEGRMVKVVVSMFLLQENVSYLKNMLLLEGFS